MYTMFFQNHVTYHTSNTPIIISWWSWWESHPCLKSYWTTISPSYLRVPIQLYLERKNTFRVFWLSMKRRTMWEPLYFDFQNLRSANFSRIVITTLESAIIAVLLSRLQSSHTHIVPQSHWRGCYPRASVNEPLPYLWPIHHQLGCVVLLLHCEKHY